MTMQMEKMVTQKKYRLQIKTILMKIMQKQKSKKNPHKKYLKYQKYKKNKQERHNTINENINLNKKL